MSENVLVVAPHPDDETLGCGGALLRHRDLNDRIFWLTLTSLSESHGWAVEVVERRAREIIQVEAMYGFTQSFHLGFPTTCLDSIPVRELVGAISKVISDVKPGVIYLPNRTDIHTDHQVAFKAAIGCTKNFRVPFIKRVLMYEVLSETNFSPALADMAFVPNVFMDITPFMGKKLDIMQVYASEVMKPCQPRGLEAMTSLASLRGCRIGVKYAEAFTLIQEII